MVIQYSSHTFNNVAGEPLSELLEGKITVYDLAISGNTLIVPSCEKKVLFFQMN